MSSRTLKVIGTASLVSMLGIVSVAQAGKIISIPTPAAPETLYFGGWNLSNVEVETWADEDKLVPALPAFNKDTGAYSEDFFTFDSKISDGDGTVMGVLHGKDYPVGEPSGIKVVNDDAAVKSPKPENCIVTTSYVDPNFLDTDNPEQTICSSGFQTHKRFKVNMEANSLNAGGAVDLVFNVEPDGSSRDYQVFQKMNNYTGSRLDGFVVQVGTGIGADFQSSGEVDVSYPDFGFSELSISVPLLTDPVSGLPDANGIWAPDELATFSHGLFGPEDLTHVPPHFADDGFFDSRPAGFYVDPVQTSGLTDTLTSGDPMPSNYTVVPVPNAIAPITSQFGPWLHDHIAPSGIFFDDDNDPNTDAALLAFWGDTGDGTYAWMFGNNNDPAFAVVDAVTLNGWASDPVYFVDVIEDMLNLGLNYVVTVGTVDASWPTWDSDSSTATFTIRMMAVESVYDTDPGYVANPAPPLDVTNPIGTVIVSPKPEFDIGEALLIHVADGNTDASSVSIVVENKSTGDIERSKPGGGVFEMFDVDGHVGLYLGELPTTADEFEITPDSGTLFAKPGDLVSITYFDDDQVGTEPTDETRAGGVTTFFVIPLPGGGAAVFDL